METLYPLLDRAYNIRCQIFFGDKQLIHNDADKYLKNCVSKNGILTVIKRESHSKNDELENYPKKFKHRLAMLCDFGILPTEEIKKYLLSAKSEIDFDNKWKSLITKGGL